MPGRRSAALAADGRAVAERDAAPEFGAVAGLESGATSVGDRASALASPVKDKPNDIHMKATATLYGTPYGNDDAPLRRWRCGAHTPRASPTSCCAGHDPPSPVDQERADIRRRRGRRRTP